MKQIFIGCLFLLTAATTIAQPISLQPGSVTEINGDKVTCLGQSTETLPPACSIKEGTVGYLYLLNIGSITATSFGSFQEAVVGAVKLKQEGLCR